MLYRAADGESLTGVAAKGPRVVVTSLRNGLWSLIAVTPRGAEVLVSDAAIKHSPRISEDDEVFFVADYGRVFNLWSLRRAGMLTRWTQAAHGVREISTPHRGEVLLTTIEADGDALRLHRLPESPIERASASTAQATPESPIPAAQAPDRPYSPWESLLPRSWLPLIELADGAVKLGVLTFGQDALALHQYSVAPVIEFTQGELLGNAVYVYDGRHGLFVDRRMTVKAGSGDEIQAYEIAELAQWISTWRHLALNRRIYWGLGAGLEREKLRQAAGPTLQAQDERVLGLVAGIDTRRTHWLSEGPSSGLQLRLFAENSYGFYSGQVVRADARLHVPLGRSVLSLRWNEARGETDAEPFQLGGSFSDPPSLLPILNQREFAFRGYTSGEASLIGHRARLGTVEWRMPLKDVDRHGMVPPVGLNRVALNLFYELGDAWARGASPGYHHSFGAELMSEIRVGYLAGADLRIGVANGADEGGKATAYLRIGRSF